MTDVTGQYGGSGRPAPGIDDEVAGSLRVMAVRIMRQRHGGNVASWPGKVREQYQVILSQHAEYEAMFGRDAEYYGALGHA